MRPTMMTIAAAALALLPSAALAAPPKGLWTNPQKSVRVVFQDCGRAMCGKIVWASPKAQADAARGGGGQLVGAMLFSDFVEQRRGLWNGSVLIPDIGQTVSGTIEQTGPDTLVGEGCLVAGFGCKRQTWTRTR
ncbi:DUF2147 domain-containing protein [Sphingomonas glacialis]|uniref:DUF2147 domain-containing protein n=1 Tax=Sphingomonas glacialis TaxID=658225 RepID=A0A502FV59_9SPHN|nr:DUF2147 domain-containing protein [Sphingomonas glacialis]TPG52986.1 DUF2147 domain-containing protein [Sphingomonas glacialis]